MFERRAAGQRIFPSETTAPSMAPAPAPMTISAADLGYLHRVSDDKLEAYEKGCQPPPIQPPASPGFSTVGYMFRRLSLRR
jgi:hypothetical protein